MSYAAAAAVGVGILGYASGQQQTAAQRDANRENRQMSEAELAEQRYEFDTSTQIGEDRYGYETGLDESRYGQQFDVGEKRYGYEAGRGEARYGYETGRDEARYGYEQTAAGEKETSRREREAEINKQIQGR